MRFGKSTGRAVLITVTLITVIFFAGCRSRDIVPSDPEIYNTTDEMWKESYYGVTLPVFKKDGRVYTVDRVYEVDEYIDDSLKDGGFYELYADVTYLNGGVAGYVDFPEINRVIEIKEISPYDLDLPSIEEESYGLMLIGDYADGDVFLNEYGQIAVWKEGSWLWEYDHANTARLEDGSVLYMAYGVTEEDAKEGIGNGILACADYILVPATE